MGFHVWCRQRARYLIWCAVFVVFPFHAYAGSSREKRNEPKPSPLTPPPVMESAGRLPPESAAEPERRLIIGTEQGLFSLLIPARPGAASAISLAGQPEALTPLWSGSAVRKIIPLPAAGGNAAAWAILSGQGVFVSTDLRDWESRNQGLPVKIIKTFENGIKSFFPVVQEVKDLEINPENPDIMVCATKDQVYLSRDQGRSWSSLGAPPYRTNGIKAVAAAYLPDGAASVLTVFLSHSTYGLFYIQPERNG